MTKLQYEALTLQLAAGLQSQSRGASRDFQGKTKGYTKFTPLPVTYGRLSVSTVLQAPPPDVWCRLKQTMTECQQTLSLVLLSPFPLVSYLSADVTGMQSKGRIFRIHSHDAQGVNKHAKTYGDA